MPFGEAALALLRVALRDPQVVTRYRDKIAAVPRFGLLVVTTPFQDGGMAASMWGPCQPPAPATGSASCA